MALTIVDPIYISTYLLPEKSQEKVEDGISREDQIKHLPFIGNIYQNKVT